MKYRYNFDIFNNSLRFSDPRTKDAYIRVKSRLPRPLFKRRYIMPSLSKFSFWMLVAGFVLFVLSAAPTKIFSFTEGHENVVFLVAVILTVAGALGFMVNREIESVERSLSDNNESVWRQIDNHSDSIHRDMESLTRRIDNIEG